MTRRVFCLVAAACLFGAGLGVVGGSASADVGPPVWWNGDCDGANWNAKAATQGWTGGGAHRLGASYLGVPVCGPRPRADGAPDVQWSRAGWGHFEWECTELAHRFMAQVYGVTAYGGNGNAVVRNYRTTYGGNLETVTNGTLGRGPEAGDVMSFDNPSSPAGHVAVVASSNLSSGTGNGTITLLSQNDTADGWRTLVVTSWRVQPFGNNTPSAWLHDPAGRGGPTSTTTTTSTTSTSTTTTTTSTTTTSTTTTTASTTTSTSSPTATTTTTRTSKTTSTSTTTPSSSTTSTRPRKSSSTSSA